MAARCSPPRSAEATPDDYEDWLRLLFPTYVASGFAEHHHQFWRWVWDLEPGVRPQPLVCLWPRGGGKSTSVELAVVAIGARRARTYVLYVSGTSKKANDHVETIANLLESDSIRAHHPSLGRRSIGLYGNSRGWRRNRLRTEAGLIVDALGLDTDTRGVKLDEHRPDLIVFDDVDDTSDSLDTINKNVVKITQKILPAGATDAATLFVQNLVHYESIAARLAGVASEEADFLADRIVSGPLPAVIGLKTERIAGTIKHRVVSGTPIWEGQDLETCQYQINDWGLRAFLAEAQHERTAPVGQAFPEWDQSVHVCQPFKIPESWPRWRAVDYGYAVPYCCLWLTRAPDGHIYAYRETYGSGKTAKDQALEVRALSAGEKYFVSVGDPAMWASNREGERYKSVADQYTEMGVALTQASNHRISGWGRLHDLLDWTAEAPPILRVFSTCTNLIRTLPLLTKDKDKPDDVDNDPSLEDHACLAGEWTQISTPYGQVPIEDIRAGDKVFDRDGIARRVTDAGGTGWKPCYDILFSNGAYLRGTADHPVWIEGKGFVRLDTLRYGDIITAWQMNPSSSTASRFVATLDRTIARTASTFGRVLGTFGGALASCIRRFGSRSTDRSPMAGTSITPTTTRSTTTPRISSPRQGSITSQSMDASIPQVPSRWTTFAPSLPNGIALMRGERGIESMRRPALASESSACRSAISVDERTRPSSRPTLDSARTPVSRRIDVPRASTTSLVPAPSAGEATRPTVSSLRRPVLDSADTVHVVRGPIYRGEFEVFNLTVEGAHEYFANGVLTHNCDALRYGAMAAQWLDTAKRSKPKGYSLGGRR